MQFSTTLIALAAAVFFGAQAAPTGIINRDTGVVNTDKAVIPEGATVEINTDKAVISVGVGKVKAGLPIFTKGESNVKPGLPNLRKADDKVNTDVPIIREGGRVDDTSVPIPKEGYGKVDTDMGNKKPTPTPEVNPDPNQVDDFTQHSGAICQSKTHPAHVLHSYALKANSGVDDVPKVCGDLWYNLHRFPGCAAASQTNCYKGTEEGSLIWLFTASNFCNPGMVQSTWYEATHNDYGAAVCVNVKELTIR
ncbi:hypothetical protein BDP55DRAFT_632807 [Colletotrichum godetiae]|uniref:Uncharacterized protein n=1 Tax=Colletotrichum godetiae TaxID=1209918 RepID=A0AAJ0ALR1_9PEZI|nr:uncharacterized protein BDP55DRAFT_632807 [Colletotrichum godetiae]KAK1674743.1 hypothetical protein BDP55DRAFT_632807 [Colletotrichum godetiae]